MKTLMKWNFLVVLFMMCSVPLLVGCGDDDDDPTVSYEWNDTGNTAVVKYSASAGGYSAAAVATFTFNGSGEDAICTKCVIEETYPTEELAKDGEKSHKNDSEMTNVKRSGKKVTFETNAFNGQTRRWLKDIFSDLYHK